jgi:integrase
VILGTNLQGWNRDRADVELERIMGLIERGNWQPPEPDAGPDPDSDLGAETLHVTATRFFSAKKAEGLEEKTEADLEWRLSYILSYRPEALTSEIDARWVDEFKTWLLGIVSKHTRRPLKPRSINMILATLATILDDAVDYKLLPANPGRGSRRRVPEKEKRRPLLEPDMVTDFLEAAGEWDAESQKAHQWGKRAFFAVLILAGPRISEATGLMLPQLDLHAEILRVLDSKTTAGERDIDLSAYLVSILRPHILAKAERVAEVDPASSPAFPNRYGRPLDDDNIRSRVILPIVERANRKRKGKLLIPADLTPHAFRRTFARLSFVAGRELDYVMGQIGHEDARMALEIYAQLRKRRVRAAERQLVWSLMRFSDEPEVYGA